MPATLTDEEMAKGLLESEKFINGNYNTFANECTDPRLKNDMVDITGKSQTMQHQLFTQMQQKGWYQVKPAPPSEVQQVKQKFSSGSTSS